MKDTRNQRVLAQRRSGASYGALAKEFRISRQRAHQIVEAMEGRAQLEGMRR